MTERPPAAAFPDPSEMSVSSPLMWGPFALKGQLGEGAMARVLWGTEARGGRPYAVAVKVPKAETYLADPSADLYFREAIEREANLGSALDDDHLINVSGADYVNGVPYVASQLLDGCSLRALLDRAKAGRCALTPNQRLDILEQCAAGLAYLHRQHVVHRDLKPSNIFVTRSGVVKLMDLGVSGRSHSSRAGWTGSSLRHFHTLGYASPEQMLGRPVTETSDVFSFGVVLFEVMLGRRLFPTPDVDPTATFISQLLSLESVLISEDAAHNLELEAPGLGAVFNQCVVDPARLRLPDGAAVEAAIAEVRQRVARVGTLSQLFREHPDLTPARELILPTPVDGTRRKQPEATAPPESSRSKESIEDPPASNAPAKRSPSQVWRRWAAASVVGVAAISGWTVWSSSPPPTWTSPTLGTTFVFVPPTGPAGFQMGAPPEERLGGEDDETVHTVVLTRPLWVAEHEVTQKDFKRVMGRNPSDDEHFRVDKGVSHIDDRFPVGLVTWWDGIQFANALSELDGLEPVYTLVDGRLHLTGVNFDANGYRLLTEAEWEWASLGGEDHTLYAGTNSQMQVCGFANIRDVNGSAHYELEGFKCDDGAALSSPVGSYTPNGYGLYDMTGNAKEWVWDAHDGDYAPGTVTDPASGLEGSNRISRGGSYYDGPEGSRLSDRDGQYRNGSSPNNGIRIARRFQ